MLGVIYVRNHGHDRRDRTFLRRRWSHEDRQITVTSEIPRPADAVLNARSHHVRRVHVAVDVSLNHAIHGNYAQPTDDSRIVRDLLGPQNDPIAITRHVGIHFGQHLRAERKCGCRCRRKLSRLQQPDHAVLNYLGERGQAFKWTLFEAKQYRIRDVSYAGLEWQQVGWHAALLHLPAQEFQDVPGNFLRGLIRGFEGTVSIWGIGEHDARNLLRRNCQVRRSDSISGADQRYRFAIRRRLEAVINIVHALERHRLPRVHLEDHPLGLIDPGLVVANRRARNQTTVFQHRRDFNERDVELAQESVLHELRHMAEMNIHIFHLAGVDPLAGLGIRLIGQPQVDSASHGQRSVQLRTGGSAGKDADLELLPAEMGLRDAMSKLDRDRFGISRAGEPAHSDLIARAD